MKRIAVTVLTIMVAVLFGCSGGGPTGTAPKGDPRDQVIKNAIKIAASSSNPLELMALFSGHPEMRKAENASVSEKMMMAALVIGGINGADLDLARLKDIKLKPSKFSTPKRYCLDGTFNYSGPAKTLAGKIEIENGTGTIFVCTANGKDGRPYLDKLEFKPDGKSVQAAKKVAKTGGK